MASDLKEQRYDRQYRLWGQHGQKHIEESNLLVLGATATGSELLKNLVLPGVGRFTLVDGEKVSAKDFGSNFFVEPGTEGKPRAQVVTDLLKELNPYVEGKYVEADPKTLIDERPEFFKDFTFVVAVQFDEETLKKLGKICWENNIPLIVARSYGLIGLIRVVVPAHDLVESKLDSAPMDLRLTNPFPELLEFATSKALGDMTTLKEHSHTPYISILIQILNQWKKEHDGNLPKTRDDKNLFKKQIISAAMDFKSEVNFSEAAAQSWRCFSAYSIPSEIQKIIDDPRADTVTAETTDFWVLINALRQFVAKEGALPLMGNIPDMTADSERYIALQKIYFNKAKSDREDISSFAEDSCKAAGRALVPDDFIEMFCKNVAALRSINFRSIEQETNPDTANKDFIGFSLQDPMSVVPFYLLLRACDRFYSQQGRFPGDTLEANIEEDCETLKEATGALLTELGAAPDAIAEPYIQEMVRYGASELHNIAALIGGVGAQEVIKVMTKQRVPLNNTWVYCGINCSGSSFEA